MANTYTWEQVISNIEGVVNCGSVSKTFTPSGSEQTYTVPQGYHSGSGVVKCSAVSLSGNADAGQVLKDKTFYNDSLTKLTGTMQIVNPTHWSEANQSGGRQVTGTDFVLGASTYNDTATHIYIKLPNNNAYYNGVDWVRIPASNLPFYDGFNGDEVTRYGYTDIYGGKNDFYVFIPNKGYYTTERYLYLNVNKVMAKIMWQVYKEANYTLVSSANRYTFRSADNTSGVPAYYLTVNISEPGLRTHVIGAIWQTNGVSMGDGNWYTMNYMGVCFDDSTGNSTYPFWQTYPGSTKTPGISMGYTYAETWAYNNPIYLPVGKPNSAFKVSIRYFTFQS